jgi:hypothetical protein
MLLAEEFLLLVTDVSGRLCASGAQVDVALAGANVIELTALGKVGLAGEQDPGRPGSIVVRDSSSAGDEVLDAALRALAARQGRKPAAALRPMSRRLRKALYPRLAAAGLVHEGQGRLLGVFPASRWPVADTGQQERLREQLAQALVQQAQPPERTAALIALAHALKREHKIVDPGRDGISKRELRARAAAIAQGNWAADAVRKVIQEMIAAASGG